MASNNICLIGGSGRSGTTILSRIFSKHPQITAVPEWRYLIDPDGIIDFYTNCESWSPYHYDLKVKRLHRLLRKVSRRNLISTIDVLPRVSKFITNLPVNFRPRYLNICTKKYCSDFKQLADHLIEQLIAFSFNGYWTGMPALQKNRIVYSPLRPQPELALILGTFLKDVMCCVLEHNKTDYYLEKNTWNILWYDKILELLPESRLVHIYRDPRDIVASYTRQTWMPADAVKSARIYKDIMERWSYVRDQVPADKYLEISLEALVADPEDVLRQICSFWDIPWNSCLLSTDLSKSNTGRWKTDLSAKAQDDIRIILSNLLKTLGYE